MQILTSAQTDLPPTLTLQPQKMSHFSGTPLPRKGGGDLKRYGDVGVDRSKLAILQEVFSSVQGEGVYVGKRQIFVRFAHCHLKCAYCDTPMTTIDGQCHVEKTPGNPKRAIYPNPLDVDTLFIILQDLLQQANHHSISFTGGEPLLYHAFLKKLLPKVRSLAPIYLETSGTQPEFLSEILPWLDFIAMDIKLSSSTGFPLPLEQHGRFYAMARENPSVECFIKLVFNLKTAPEELMAVRHIVTNPNTPIILQPETALSDQRVTVDPGHLLLLENALGDYFSDVRVIPQTHKMLNVL